MPAERRGVRHLRLRRRRSRKPGIFLIYHADAGDAERLSTSAIEAEPRSEKSGRPGEGPANREGRRHSGVRLADAAPAATSWDAVRESVIRLPAKKGGDVER